MKTDKERILELIRIADEMQKKIDEFIKDYEHYLEE